MASITGMHNGERGWTLEVIPIAYDDWCPNGGYRVRFQRAETAVYDRQFSFNTWIDGHAYVEGLADGFQFSPHLIGEYVRCEPGQESGDADEEEEPIAMLQYPVSIECGPWWLSVTIHAATLRQFQGSLVCSCQLELDEEYLPGISKSIVVLLAVASDDAARFGKCLRAECLTADAARKGE